MDVKDIGKTISKITSENEIFTDKSRLDPLAPETTNIIGREKEAETLLRYLVGHTKGQVIPLISVYGRSGAGKSTLVRFILDNTPEITYCFANLRKAKTIFGAVNIILGELGEQQVKSAQGLNVAIDRIRNAICATKKSNLFVLVLDEFDVIFYDKRNNPSDFVYKLVELHSELKRSGHKISIITISNNVIAEYAIDDRVKSRIGTSEVFFTPYKKHEVLEILKSRAKLAFKKKINPDVLARCADLSSIEHGDARRAIDLLRVAAEIASAEKKEITTKHVDSASERLQRDRIVDAISSLSYHSKAACMVLAVKTYGLEQDWHTTATLYERYKQLLEKKISPLTYRRFSEILKDLENAGIVESKTGSRGRHGYNSEFMISVNPQTVGNAIDPKWWEEYVVKVKNNIPSNVVKPKKNDVFYELYEAASKMYEDYW
jgi:archaeal cell division control protein 6